MNQRQWYRVAAVIAVLACVSRAVAEGKTRAARKPLTHHDSGLYCNLRFTHGADPKDEKLTNMLTPQRAVSKDSPWSFYIFQLDAPARPEDARLIEQKAAGGKKIVLRAHVGRLTANPNPDELEQRLVGLLKGINPDWIHAVILGEEQVYWNGWANALAELYRRSKKRWPDLPVYQWWSPMEVPDVRATSGWVALPADGWVIDLYGMGREAFEKKLVQTLETGKPVIHIVWSSPEWPDFSGAASWKDGGRRIFDDQLEICRSYNVPVAHFCTQSGRKDGTIRWGWHAPDPVVRDWYRSIEVLAENTRRLPDSAMGFRTPDKKLFDWARSSDSPQGLSLVLDEQGRKRMTAPVNLSTVPLKSGEHVIKLGEAGTYFKVTCILDGSVSNLTTGLGVPGVVGRVSAATVTFRIEPLRPVAGVSVTAHTFANSNALGGAASVSASSDGKEWSVPTGSDARTQTHALTVQRPADRTGKQAFSKAPLWVRVNLAANSGVKTAAAASLSQLEITAAIAPRLE